MIRIRVQIPGYMILLVAFLPSCMTGPEEAIPRVPAKPAQIGTFDGIAVAGKSREGVRINAVQLGTLFQMLEEERVLVVDVRPAFFFRLGHIRGAANLPLKNFESRIGTFLKTLEAAIRTGKDIVVYCADDNCPDSLTTARNFARMGYSTSVYRGGWKEWRSAGL